MHRPRIRPRFETRRIGKSARDEAQLVSVSRTRSRNRRRDGMRGGFRVVPQRRADEETFVVVTLEGAPLYSFSDLRAATEEAATLNAVHEPRR
jgi:hypothetical protein